MQSSLTHQFYTDSFRELRERITSQNLHTPSPIFGSMAIVLVSMFFVFGLVFMGWFHPIIVIGYFFVILVELGFVSHDLIHGQYFQRPSYNRFFSYIIANLFTGLSRSWWMDKHNIGHHTFTNSDIHDTDIRDYDEIFTGNGGKSPFFHKHKKILFWFATSILYFNLIFRSYEYIIREKKYGEMILNLLSILLLPTMLVLNFWLLLWIGMLFLIYILVGIHLAFVFMVNHIGMPIIDGTTIKEYAWLDLQTQTSRNIRGWICIHHVFWGLNKQIEHHLFPLISRHKIGKISKEVKAFCKEKWIPYHEVSFGQALREIWKTLKTGETIKIYQ